jgi:hypothetical protein
MRQTLIALPVTIGMALEVLPPLGRGEVSIIIYMYTVH